jgi:hypothetical protein
VVPQGSRYSVIFNTPYEEGAKAINPASAVQYGISTLGAIPSEATRLAQPGAIQDVASGGVGGVANAIGRFIFPGWSTLDTATFKSNAPDAVRRVLGILGAYPRNDPTLFTKLIEEYKAQGLSQFDAQRAAERAARSYYSGR